MTVSVLSLTYLLPSLVLPSIITSADALKGLTRCMNDQDCLGVNRVCSHDAGQLEGECVCQEGFIQEAEDSFACAKKADPLTRHFHNSCNSDEDCKRNEVCMTWKYDPNLELARRLRSRISPEVVEEKHQICVDAWVIYKNHIGSLERIEEPRTGGGLRSRQFDVPEDYFFGARRPPRVQQQYIGFAEDMMLILFLVCILATLVTVHRAACYRSLQDARRNTPLRHILPLAEDRPPPYVTNSHDSTDGLSELINSVSVPKSQSETPPPTYEEALYRQSVRLPPPEDVEAGPAGPSVLLDGATGGSELPPSLSPAALGDLQVHAEDAGLVTEALLEEIRPTVESGDNDPTQAEENLGDDEVSSPERENDACEPREPSVVLHIMNEDDQDKKTEEAVMEKKNEPVMKMITDEYRDNCDNNLIV